MPLLLPSFQKQSDKQLPDTSMDRINRTIFFFWNHPDLFWKHRKKKVYRIHNCAQPLIQQNINTNGWLQISPSSTSWMSYTLTLHLGRQEQKNTGPIG